MPNLLGDYCQDAEQLATRIFFGTLVAKERFHNRQGKKDQRAAARLTAEGQQWEVRSGWKETLPSYHQIMTQGIFNPDPFDGAAIRNVASLPDHIKPAIYLSAAKREARKRNRKYRLAAMPRLTNGTAIISCMRCGIPQNVAAVHQFGVMHLCEECYTVSIDRIWLCFNPLSKWSNLSEEMAVAVIIKALIEEISPLDFAALIHSDHKSTIDIESSPNNKTCNFCCANSRVRALQELAFSDGKLMTSCESSILQVAEFNNLQPNRHEATWEKLAMMDIQELAQFCAACGDKDHGGRNFTKEKFHMFLRAILPHWVARLVEKIQELTAPAVPGAALAALLVATAAAELVNAAAAVATTPAPEVFPTCWVFDQQTLKVLGNATVDEDVKNEIRTILQMEHDVQNPTQESIISAAAHIDVRNILRRHNVAIPVTDATATPTIPLPWRVPALQDNRVALVLKIELRQKLRREGFRAGGFVPEDKQLEIKEIVANRSPPPRLEALHDHRVPLAAKVDIRNMLRRSGYNPSGEGITSEDWDVHADVRIILRRHGIDLSIFDVH